MVSIRPFRTGDEAALARICLLTADSGADATGVLDDDELWAEVFVLPYVARHPEFAFVLQGDDDSVIGYVVGAPDTDDFERWFHDEWWPPRAPRFRRDGTPRQHSILRYADGRRAGAEPYGDRYPAHLHIDLLPEAQGHGWGRALIATLLDALRARGVRGVHLVAAAANEGAVAFYPRVGFAEIPSHEGTRAFAVDL